MFTLTVESLTVNICEVIVEEHVRFAEDLAHRMGGIKVTIGASLHCQSLRHLCSEAVNLNVNEAITLLCQWLVDPAFTTVKHLDTRAFIIPHVVLWEHSPQLHGDGVHLTGMGQACL